MSEGFKLPDYGKVWNLGHPEVASIFDGPVVAQEKIDGSQFSFMRDAAGDLHFRSRNALVYEGDGGMFSLGCVAVRRCSHDLPEGLVVRGEYLAKPKHNTIAYERTPCMHIMLFDASDLHGNWLARAELEALADVLGFEVVPEVVVDVQSADDLERVTEGSSVLGGPMEGVVFKAYGRHDTRGHLLKAKYVRPRFRELNKQESPAKTASQGDVVEALTARHRSEARWEKAVYRLRDRGELTNSPKDIGPLLAEVVRDAEEELAEDAKRVLWHWAKGRVLRGVRAGLPEWYKARLLAQQFETNGAEP